MKRPHRTPLMLDVKRMAVWVGPGLRTAFFVKGCPLKCVWCHNPESIDPQPQEARFRHLCRHCARCTHDEATCPTRAFKLYGRPWTLDALVAKALEDRPFYDASGGGVTLSGGEPLFFWESGATWSASSRPVRSWRCGASPCRAARTAKTLPRATAILRRSASLTARSSISNTSTMRGRSILRSA